MNNKKLTKDAQNAITKATSATKRLGQPYIGTEHILLGLLDIKSGVAYRVLEENNINYKKVENKIIEFIKNDNESKSDEKSSKLQGYTPRAKGMLGSSLNESFMLNTVYIGTEHLLLAILRDKQCMGTKVLEGLGFKSEFLIERIFNAIGSPSKSPFKQQSLQSAKNKKSTTPTLDNYSRDLTALAKDNYFDPTIGRSDEIERLIQILSRRTKNNPCLVGEPGVGKTALVEGLAMKIVDGDVPELLKNKRVLALDLSAMLAGSKYRGEFEDRLKKVLKEIDANKNILLFIDEIHTIIGAGSAEGAIDASNIMKPALARGEIKVIGATTHEEFRKYIEKDASIERRFQRIVVEEPSEEEAIKMLLSLKPKYEEHHNVSIEDDAIISAVKLSNRYINDRFLPDKAIDIIDETSSRVKLATYIMPDSFKKLEEKILNIDIEKEDAIVKEDFALAGKLKAEKEKLIKRKERSLDKFEKERLESDDIVSKDLIEDTIAKMTGIPVKKIQEEESHKLLALEEELGKRVIGQKEAVTSIAKCIRRNRVGLKNPNRPIGSFLFLGPTGVGKTELSKALSEILFGSDDDIIRVDMSEFMEPHSVSKLIGAPPGYVGFDEGGTLVEKIRKKPYSLLLLDEVEKAHPDVFNLMLQVLDDGHITDSKGRKVNFKNTLIIMTSNIGAKNIVEPKKLGFSSGLSEEEKHTNMKNAVMGELKNFFKPEFLNRIDDITVFHKLSKEDISHITELLLEDLKERAKLNLDLTLSFTDNLIDYISKEGYSNIYGARPLKRTIQSKLEDEIAEKILFGEFQSGDKIKIDYKDEELNFKVSKSRKKAIA